MRPSGITALAYWQFSKAAYLLLVGMVGLVYSMPGLSTHSFVGLFVYIAAHGLQPSVILLPVIALVPAAFGWGLWRLRPWARNAVLITSGVTVVRWLTGLLIRAWALEERVFPTSIQRNTVVVLLVIDSMIFLYLINSDVKRAFAGADERA